MPSLLLVLSCISGIVALASGTRHTEVVQIEGGSIRGFLETLSNNQVVRKYLGVPYAKAERFEHPTAPDSWTGVKDVTSFGKVCFQFLFPEPFGYQFADMSEDCLNLNIYVPNTRTSGSRPVMVWIHGGGFASNSNRIADGSYLATLGDVIVVVINYRLGPFGFMASRDFGLRGNYGLYDQMKALRWVQNNINK